MGTGIIILVILIIHAIGLVLYRYYKPRFKGLRGEKKVASLLKRLDQTEYKIYNDLYLKTEQQITQIDHLVVSPYGIFVIETKNYRGWIHGSENSAYWTQSIYKKKIKFRNPVKQNWAHLQLLKSILQNYKQIKYFSIIVFAGSAELKNVYSKTPVVYKNKLLSTIKEKQELNLTEEEIATILNQINNYKTQEQKDKKEHRKYVKKRIHKRKGKAKALLCPNCDGQLVLKKGPYGKFYGCSNFPYCKYSKKVGRNILS